MHSGGFSLTDYVIFGVLCTASCLGGMWFGAKGSRKKVVKDVREYLLGGKTMSTFPVAMSLIASYVSGVTILGTPAEIYNYGTQYWLIIIAVTLSTATVAIVYLPVFITLRLSSSYEYLELRFDRYVRAVASVLFMVDEVLFLPMVVYVPALAFNQMTGISVFTVSGVMVAICGIYTVFGGLRAVVWTDSVQTGTMFIGVIIVAAAGTISVGGCGKVFEVAKLNNRLDLNNWSLSPYERQSGWAVLIGGYFYWTAFNSVNQTMVQRYIALSNKKKARAALGIFCIGAILAITLCVWCGLVAFTSWVLSGCDVDAQPLVDDRMLPAFVIEVSKTQRLPGLSGVFLAGVFGAGLSSLSVVLNACALVLVEDIMHSWLRIRLKPLIEGILARIFTAILAIVSLLMVFVVSKLGGVLGVATALSAIAASTSCGIFTLGMACPWVGSKGAIAGGVAGALVAGTVSLGTQAAAAAGLRQPPLPVSDQCALNATFSLQQPIDPETIFPLFRVSYHWIAPLGVLTTITVGAIMGYILDKNSDIKKDAELFTPLVWRWLPEEFHTRKGETRRNLTRETNEPVPPLPLLLEKMDSKTEINAEGSR